MYSYSISTTRRLGFSYPPFAALALYLLTWVPLSMVTAGWSVGVIGALFVSMWWTLPDRMRHLPARRLGPLCAGITAVALFFGPVRDTFSFGQVGLFLALPVLADVRALRRGSRWAGVGIGIAAALKLTPAIFVLYLVVTGRTRPAITALAAAGFSTLIAAAVSPSVSASYWLNIVWQTDRIGSIGSSSNQSLFGLVTRLANDDAYGGHAPLAAYVGPCAVVTIVGLRRARCAFIAGDDSAGVVLTGLLAGLISPISWVHHLYWIVPACVILVDVSLVRGRALPALLAGCIYLVGVSHVIEANFRPAGQHHTHSLLGVLGENAYVVISLVLLMSTPSRPAMWRGGGG
ncbi:MAG: glycosyltransferase 87 family protein [Jatrophihabitans sp.]